VEVEKEMTKAEKFKNSVQDEQISDVALLAKARAASGQEPDEFIAVSTEGAGEWDFHFDDGSILNVTIVERNQPGKRLLSVQIPPSQASQ
jgi:hypothetical protein